jgi:transcriptional regulator with XRE-family HTH domain
MTLSDLAKKAGVDGGTLTHWEQNLVAPEPEMVAPLAQALRIPLWILVRALNHTFHPGLDIRPLFGNLPIYLVPGSSDAEKVRQYLEKPGTLGQWVFALRKMLPDSPRSSTFAHRMGRDRAYVDVRELNRIPLDATGLSDWFQYFENLGVPRDLVEKTAQAQGVEVSDSVWLVAREAQGRSVTQMAEAGAVEKRTMRKLVKDPQAVLLPSTLLSMAGSMGPGAGAKLFTSVYPKILEIFPETREETPHLVGDTQVFRAAMVEFNLAERLFAFRMNPPEDLPGIKLQKDGTLNYRSAAKLAGIPEDGWRRYERGYHWIETDEVLIKLATVLRIDPRILYIHYRPEILKLFPLRSSAAQQPQELEEKTWYRWYRDAQSDFDRSNLRRKLSPRLASVMVQQGVKDVETYLHQALANHPGLAEKLLAVGQAPTPEEMKIIDGILPQGPTYREWFEHYYRPELQFFLGKREGGGYDYSLPNGLSWAAFKAWDIPHMLSHSFQTKSAPSEERKTFTQILWDEKRYERGRFPLNAIPFLSRTSGIHQKLLYLWSRREELDPIMGGEK